MRCLALCEKMEDDCTAGHACGCSRSGRVVTGVGVATGRSCRLVLMLTASDVVVAVFDGSCPFNVVGTDVDV